MVIVLFYSCYMCVVIMGNIMKPSSRIGEENKSGLQRVWSIGSEHRHVTDRDLLGSAQPIIILVINPPFSLNFKSKF